MVGAMVGITNARCEARFRTAHYRKCTWGDFKRRQIAWDIRCSEAVEQRKDRSRRLKNTRKHKERMSLSCSESDAACFIGTEPLPFCTLAAKPPNRRLPSKLKKSRSLSTPAS